MQILCRVLKVNKSGTYTVFTGIQDDHFFLNYIEKFGGDMP